MILASRCTSCFVPCSLVPWVLNAFPSGTSSFLVLCNGNFIWAFWVFQHWECLGLPVFVLSCMLSVPACRMFGCIFQLSRNQRIVLGSWRCVCTLYVGALVAYAALVHPGCETASADMFATNRSKGAPRRTSRLPLAINEHRHSTTMGWVYTSGRPSHWHVAHAATCSREQFSTEQRIDKGEISLLRDACN